MEMSSMRGEQLHEVHQELRTIPNVDFPLSIIATVARLCGGYKNLGALYGEQGVPEGASTIEYRVFWMSDRAFGVVEGHSADPNWNGMENQEPDHEIVGKIRRLDDLREVAFATSPIVHRGFNTSVVIEAPITLSFTDGEKLVVPKYRITHGGSAQRDMADRFIDRALEAVGGSPSAERPQ